MWRSRGHRGDALEMLLDMTHQYYHQLKLCRIDKISTPIKVVAIDDTGMITKAFFEKKSTVDFLGIIQGVCVAFDAKETNLKSLPLQNIHAHQIEYMADIEFQGGLSFIIVHFKFNDRFYLVPFEMIKRYSESDKRRSIPFSAMLEQLEIKRERCGSILNYLPALNEYVKYKTKNSEVNMKVFKVNSFTYNRTGGNPAGIILLDAPLSDARKQEIAKTLGYSETAFVLKSNGALADFELSFFTPTDEVPLCGHATIAAFSVLYQERLLPKFHLVQQTKAGCLRIEVEEGSAMVFMEQTTPKGQAISESSVRDLGRIFHLPVESLACEYDALSHSFPLNAEIWDTGIRDIILPIKNRALLNALKIDFDALSKLSKSEDVCGVHAFTYEDGQFYARNFAPLFGIDEESATGTSNGALTGYLYHHIRQNGFAKMKTLELKILQGEAMNATSEIHTRCLDENGLTPEIWVGGMATVEETFEI